MLVALLFFIFAATVFLCHKRKRAFYRWILAEGVLALLLTAPVMFFNLFLPYSFELSLTVFIGFWCFLGLLGLGLIYALPANINYTNFQYFNQDKQEFCPHCGVPISSDANYCNTCNNPIARTYDYDTL